MTATNLLLTLGSLCESEEPEITGQGIEENDDRTAFAQLIDHGALVHIGNATAVLCLGCDDPHSISVEYCGEGLYRAFCSDSGYQDIQADALRRFVVDENWIASTVATALGLNFNKTTGPSTVTRVGRARFGTYACELFFGRRLSEKSRIRRGQADCCTANWEGAGNHHDVNSTRFDPWRSTATLRPHPSGRSAAGLSHKHHHRRRAYLCRSPWKRLSLSRGRHRLRVQSGLPFRGRWRSGIFIHRQAGSRNRSSL